MVSWTSLNELKNDTFPRVLGSSKGFIALKTIFTGVEAKNDIKSPKKKWIPVISLVFCLALLTN